MLMSKENALQWWAFVSRLGSRPQTSVDFKRFFSSVWITPTLEVDVILELRNLKSIGYKDINEYTTKFWKALLLINANEEVPLTYIYGISNGVGGHLLRQKVKHISKLVEIAKLGQDARVLVEQWSISHNLWRLQS